MGKSGPDPTGDTVWVACAVRMPTDSPSRRNWRWSLVLAIFVLAFVTLHFAGIARWQSARSGRAAPDWFVLGVGIVWVAVVSGDLTSRARARRRGETRLTESLTDGSQIARSQFLRAIVDISSWDDLVHHSLRFRSLRRLEQRHGRRLPGIWIDERLAMVPLAESGASRFAWRAYPAWGLRARFVAPAVAFVTA